MEIKNINDKETAWSLFREGQLTDDYNRLNYTTEQFKVAWSEWINFYALYDKDDPVCFCGARKFGNSLVRIFDRYYIFPDYRSNNLKHATHSTLMIKRMIHDSFSNNLQPFISIQEYRKRGSLTIAVKKFNKYLDNNKQLKVLDGLYCTVPSQKQKVTSWQNIATTYPFTVSLEHKNEQKNTNVNNTERIF